MCDLHCMTFLQFDTLSWGRVQDSSFDQLHDKLWQLSHQHSFWVVEWPLIPHLWCIVLYYSNERTSAFSLHLSDAWFSVFLMIFSQTVNYLCSLSETHSFYALIMYLQNVVKWVIPDSMSYIFIFSFVSLVVLKILKITSKHLKFLLGKILKPSVLLSLVF